MVNFADLDTSFLVPCKHCAELLQEGERFCPSCGKDQTVTDDAGVARSDVEPERGTSAGSEALAPTAVEYALMPRQQTQAAFGHPVPTSAANEEVHSEGGVVRPGAFRQKEVPAGGGPEPGAGSSVTRSRLLIGIAALLVVLLLLAVVHDHFYVDTQSEVGKLQEFRANVEQVQSALSRGDLGAAQRVLSTLGADRANDPGVQQLRQELARRMQEQAGKQEQPGDAALKASRALGLGEPAAPPAQAPLPPQAPKVAMPAPPAIGVADPKRKECDEALAALALCPNR